VPDSVYRLLRDAVCDKKSCWQVQPVVEAGVTADCGSGWIYFRLERHFKRCASKQQKASEICDALAAPRQTSRRSMIFLELKTSGKAAKAVDQIRKGAEKILETDIPVDIALKGEIWHKRQPKSPIRRKKIITVDGREIFIRHRQSL
jgi:hypothetical protein